MPSAGLSDRSDHDNSGGSYAEPKATIPDLSTVQDRALESIRNRAVEHQASAQSTITRILAEARRVHLDAGVLILSIAKNSRVTLNFHPDRILPTGINVVDGLIRDGHYYSQFVTGVTNGSRSAFPGGNRDRWEEELFAGAYNAPRISANQRPKYGALNIMNYPDGASPRFGSCYLRLKPSISERCTFSFGDSHLQPDCVGTMDLFEPLLAGMLQSVESTGMVLGTAGIDLPDLLDYLSHLSDTDPNHLSCVMGRALDDYIEAQVHGPIDLANDVEALVADPSYLSTSTADQMEQLAFQYRLPLLWHRGFRLSAESVPGDFRGLAIPPFARLVASEFAVHSGQLDAATIGRAASSFHFHPERWEEIGSPDEVFTYLKQLWHVLVQFGSAVH